MMPVSDVLLQEDGVKFPLITITLVVLWMLYTRIKMDLDKYGKGSVAGCLVSRCLHILMCEFVYLARSTSTIL